MLSSPFRRDRHLRKIGPRLARELMSSCQESTNTKTAALLLACHSPRGLRLARRHSDVLFENEPLGLAFVHFPLDQVEGFARETAIACLERDHAFTTVPVTRAMTTEPLNVDVVAIYKSSSALANLDGDDVVVQIQDTGFTPHPDIPQAVEVIDCTGEGTTRDYSGHGTAITSQFAARGPFPGLVPNATVQMARIFDRSGQTSLSAILKAHALAAERGVHVVSMSYGSPQPQPLLGWALRRLSSAGICLVAAAGNSGPGLGTVEYPGAYEQVLAVAALTKTGKLAPFSSRGAPGHLPSKPDVAAEGVNIVMARSQDHTMGTPFDETHIVASGTSFSAPIIAALACMMRQARGILTTEQAREILTSAAFR